MSSSSSVYVNPLRDERNYYNQSSSHLHAKYGPTGTGMMHLICLLAESEAAQEKVRIARDGLVVHLPSSAPAVIVEPFIALTVNSRMLT